MVEWSFSLNVLIVCSQGSSHKRVASNTSQHKRIESGNTEKDKSIKLDKGSHGESHKSGHSDGLSTSPYLSLPGSLSSTVKLSLSDRSMKKKNHQHLLQSAPVTHLETSQPHPEADPSKPSKEKGPSTESPSRPRVPTPFLFPDTLSCLF